MLKAYADDGAKGYMVFIGLTREDCDTMQRGNFKMFSPHADARGQGIQGELHTITIIAGMDDKDLMARFAKATEATGNKLTIAPGTIIESKSAASKPLKHVKAEYDLARVEVKIPREHWRTFTKRLDTIGLSMLKEGDAGDGIFVEVDIIAPSPLVSVIDQICSEILTASQN